MNSACVPESTRSLCCTFQMFVHDKMQIIKSRFPNYTEFNNYLINMSNNTDINKTISFVMQRDFVLHCCRYILKCILVSCITFHPHLQLLTVSQILDSIILCINCKKMPKCALFIIQCIAQKKN